MTAEGTTSMRILSMLKSDSITDLPKLLPNFIPKNYSGNHAGYMGWGGGVNLRWCCECCNNFDKFARTLLDLFFRLKTSGRSM